MALDTNATIAANVGISVTNAVDVANKAADFMLLDPDIDVISKVRK